MLFPKYLAEEARRWGGCINFPQHTWLYLHLHLCYIGCPSSLPAISPYGISPSPQLEGAGLFAREGGGECMGEAGAAVRARWPWRAYSALPFATDPFSSFISAFLLPANRQYLVYWGPLEPGTAIKNSQVLLSCCSVGWTGWAQMCHVQRSLIGESLAVVPGWGLLELGTESSIASALWRTPGAFRSLPVFTTCALLSRLPQQCTGAQAMRILPFTQKRHHCVKPTHFCRQGKTLNHQAAS